VALSWLVLLTAAAFLVDILPLPSALNLDLSSRFAAPGFKHWMGTDELGRDVLSRLLHAARSTLIITVGATFLDILIATIASLVAAYRSGWIDRSLSITVDFFWSVPLVVLVVLVTSIIGVQVSTLIVTIAGINWVSATRILRAESYRLRNAPFVRAARAGPMPRYVLPIDTSPLRH
jgi:peptide/nickel transport system permease protein